ncbi:MAG TPA: efflux RND transporter periplasmic adaptor subunit, partial [Bacteroidales bacterium]|nr:efflux RND transporter periplasmic adaptor subunit [Bacteroidales bacterium]
LVETVAANGKIQPETEVKITPYISGEIVELYVREGDEVSAGDLLAIVDPELYITAQARAMASLNTTKANEASARARLAQTEAQFKNSELNFYRTKSLWEQKVISNSEFESAEANYQVAAAEVDAAKQSLIAAEYNVKSAEANVKEANENLTKTKIYAPISGTVSLLNIEKGERVAGASTFSAGTEILRIANLAAMEVNVEVNENDIIRVELNDTCLIEVDAHLGKKFTGIVTEIATSANTAGTSADQITNFDVKIRILPSSYSELLKADDPTYAPLRPGMSATVDIQTNTASHVLTVPIQAVTTRTDTLGAANNTREQGIPEFEENANPVEPEEKDEKATQLTVVFVIENNTAILRTVETGIQDNQYIVITDGLEEGEKVITGPYRAISRTLKHNTAVMEVDKEELFKE